MRIDLNKPISFGGGTFYLKAFDGEMAIFDDQWYEKKNITTEVKSLSLNLYEIIEVLNFLSIFSRQFDYKSQESKDIGKLISIIDNLTHKAIMAKGFTCRQAATIYSKAYDDGHHAGYSEVANYCIDYCEFARNILDDN